MIRIGFTFLAGRYHGTPWGRHVNEGAIEWPPSPWRIVRSLLATGYSKLGWTSVPEVGRELVEALASRPPEYWIPPECPGSHTRHYMPDGAVAEFRKDKKIYNRGTDLVIDAFITLPRDAIGLVVGWEVELDASAQALLSRLTCTMSYLGRAEAWVHAALVDQVPATLWPCRMADAPPDSHWERIELLAPLSEPSFRDWRATWLAAQAPAAKKSGRAKGGRIEPAASLVDALQACTGALQGEGWSQPPGSRWLAYWRRPAAIVERPSVRRPTVRASAFRPTTALFALASNAVNGEVLPHRTQALWQGETVHRTLVSLSADPAGKRSPSSLTGRDEAGAPLVGHQHAYVLALTLERRSHQMDHVLVHAPMGFDADALRGLQRVRKTYAKGLSSLYLTLIGLGGPRDFSRRVPELGIARVWESATPFVLPRHLKHRGKDTLVGQVIAECAARGLPVPTAVAVQLERDGLDAGSQWLPGARFEELHARACGLRFKGKEGLEPLAPGMRLAGKWRHFRRARRDDRKAPPSDFAVGLRVTFAEDVSGPIALGYGSHFGLGLMRPAARP